MSVFGKIRDAIFGKPRPTTGGTATVPGGTTTAAPSPTVDVTQSPGAAPPQPATAPGTTPTDDAQVTRGGGSVIDIENHLDAMPGADNLNWRTSIVDLMKLVGIDSDYESRAALAQELGRPDYDGSAEDNVWLHRQVMDGLTSHGGSVPTQFTD